MKSRIRNSLVALTLLAGLTQTARAADTSRYVVNKHQNFNQTSSGSAVFQTNGPPYEFEATANANAPGLVLGLSVKLPDGTSQSGALQTDQPGYTLNTNFSTLTALDAAYPVGQYVLTISTAHDGTKIVTINLPASVYPSTPHISNFNAAQNINPLADFTLAWDVFTNGVASDLIQLQISDASGNTIFSSPTDFGAGTLTGLSNSVVIPANTFTAGQTYSAIIWFYKIINVDTTSYPGATGITLFWKRTFFNLQTANPFGIFPIATNATITEVGGALGGFSTSSSNSLVGILANTNVCVQLVSSNGTLNGSLVTIGHSLGVPRVAFGSTNYLVVWFDDFVSSPLGQIISSSGATVGSPFLLGATGLTLSAVTSDGTNYLVVLRDNSKFYHGQLVTSAGILSGSQFLITSQQQNGSSSAVSFGKTNYLVVWQSNNGSIGNTNQVYGEFVSRTGSAGSPFQIGQTASVDQNPLTVAFDGTNYLVVWPWDPGPETFASVTNWDLYGRLVSQTGTFPGSELTLVTDPGSQYFPSLAFDGSNYLLNWGDTPSGAALSSTNSYIRFQFLNRSASTIGPKFTAFPIEGTNSPILGGVCFDGTRFVAVGVLGSGSSLPGTSDVVFGGFISASTTPPTLAAGNHVGTQFPLQLTGTPGINYAIQTSTNLTSSNWTMVGTNSPTNGTFSFTDTHATNASRFYRAVKQ